MSYYQIFIWGKFSKKGHPLTKPVRVSLPIKQIKDEIVPTIRQKYPHAWISVHVDDHKLELVYESPPKGFENKKLLDEKILKKEGLVNRYGKRELPIVMHRPGKGRRMDKFRIKKDPKPTSVDYRDLTQGGYLEEKK